MPSMPTFVASQQHKKCTIFNAAAFPMKQDQYFVTPFKLSIRTQGLILIALQKVLRQL